MKLITLFLLACSLWAGQSISLSNFGAALNTFPAQSKSNPWRLEMYITDLDCSGTREIFDEPAIGMRLRCIGGGTLTLNTSYWNTGELGSCQFTAGTDLYLRIQRDPAGFSYCEAWTSAGVRFYNATTTFTGVTADTSTGLTMGNLSGNAGIAAQARVAFFRLHSTLLALNSTPPTTFNNTARIMEWKLDGGLTDSSGNGYNIATTNGTAVYTATPNQGNYARPKVKATTWADWTSLRAGFENPITGSGSYSQSDASNTVTCFWQIVSGADRGGKIRTQNACDTYADETTFGPYTLQLTVSGAAGDPGTATIDIGAVATDVNGVVIQGNSVADNIFGSMMSFGRNPWAYADDAALRALTIRGAAAYATSYSKDWLNYGAGTIAYKANSFVSNLTTLSTTINATDTSIIVASTTNLILSSFPTIIQFGFGGERVLICSSAGTTLTVCPDGRGWALNPTSGDTRTATQAQAHTAGAGIVQPIARWDGTGPSTSFLNDYCSGRQGPFTGTAAVSAGTVAATAGSTTLTATDANWNGTPNATGNVFAGMMIRFSGVISGAPFEFITDVASIGSGLVSTLVMSRAYPAGATNVSGVTYQIYYANAFFTPRWDRPDSTNGHIRFSEPACISATQVVFGGGLEAWTGPQTGQQHSKSTQNWMTQGGNGTPNFYDEVAAHYAMYLRSGAQAALDAARWIGDVWAKSPEFDEGWGLGVGIPRNVGALGMLASWQIDGRNWNYALNKLAKGAQATVTAKGTNCLDGDLREDAYTFMWLAMAAQYETDPTDKASFIASLATLLTREEACQAADGYYPSYNYYNFFTPNVTFTNGSKDGTGVGLSTAMCESLSTGTGSVTGGSATMTGTAIPAKAVNQSISVSGTKAGVPFSWQGGWSGSGSSVTLSGLWAGADGPVTWIIHEKTGLWGNLDSSEYHTMFSSAINDATFNVANPCFYNSSTSITLAKPWTGANGSFGFYRGNIVGAGMQPFMGGIKTLEYLFAKQATTGSIQTRYNTLIDEIAGWIKSTGYDPRTKGLFYGRGFGACEVPVDPPGFNPATFTSSPSFPYSLAGCQYGFGQGAVGAARALNSEAQNVLRLIYEASPTTPNRDFGDNFYGGQWGKAGFTTAGFATDDGFDNIYADNGALGAGKWYGFQFGLGMAHQWPAVRLGGVTPPVLVAKTIKARLADVSGAVDIVIDYLAPSGLVSSSAPCTSSACTFNVNSVEGTYLYKVRYRNGSGATIAPGIFLPVK
jgi:hypothetical protein